VQFDVFDRDGTADIERRKLVGELFARQDKVHLQWESLMQKDQSDKREKGRKRKGTDRGRKRERETTMISAEMNISKIKKPKRQVGRRKERKPQKHKHKRDGIAPNVQDARRRQKEARTSRAVAGQQPSSAQTLQGTPITDEKPKENKNKIINKNERERTRRNERWICSERLRASLHRSRFPLHEFLQNQRIL